MGIFCQGGFFGGRGRLAWKHHRAIKAADASLVDTPGTLGASLRIYRIGLGRKKLFLCISALSSKICSYFEKLPKHPGVIAVYTVMKM